MKRSKRRGFAGSEYEYVEGENYTYDEIPEEELKQIKDKIRFAAIARKKKRKKLYIKAIIIIFLSWGLVSFIVFKVLKF